MRCAEARRRLSARIDGEPEVTAGRARGPAAAAATDRHLDGCPACRAWLDAAHDVTRRSRLAAVHDGDAAARITAAVAARAAGGGPARPGRVNEHMTDPFAEDRRKPGGSNAGPAV